MDDVAARNVANPFAEFYGTPDTLARDGDEGARVEWIRLNGFFDGELRDNCSEYNYIFVIYILPGYAIRWTPRLFLEEEYLGRK